MSKLELRPIVSGYRSAEGFNSNFQDIVDAIENTLSRDGLSPNQMEADLDLNGNRILNLPAPSFPTDPVRLQDIVDIEAGDFTVSLGIDDEITNGETERAPSQNAVYDALALKADADDVAPLVHTHAQSDVTGLVSALALKASNDLTSVSDVDFATKAAAAGVGGGGAGVADAINDGVTTVAPSQNAVYDALLLKADDDLTNVSNADFLAKATAAGVGTGESVGGLISLTAYGAVLDGVTSDLAAWNDAVVDINAGIISGFYVPPGTVLLDGDTTQISGKGFVIKGAGMKHSRINSTSGTNPVVSANNVSLEESITLEDLTFETTQSEAKDCINIDYVDAPDGAHSRLVMRNIDIRAGGSGFTRGVVINNGYYSQFDNVNIVGRISDSTMAGHEHMTEGFYLTATSGSYALEYYFNNCNVAGCKFAWWVRGHHEGHVWQACNIAFVTQGINIDVTSNGDVTGAPSWNISDCWVEAYTNCIYVNGLAYAVFSGNTLLRNANGSGTGFLINIGNSQAIRVSNNTMISVDDAGQTTHGIFVNNTLDCTTSNNSISGLNGYGIYWGGTSSLCLSHGDSLFDLGSNSIIYRNDVSGSDWTGTLNALRNTRRNMRVRGTVQPVHAKNKLSSPLSVGTANTTLTASVSLPVEPGDKVRFTYFQNSSNPTVAAQIIHMPIREWTHRPASGSPYQVISCGFDRNQVLNTAYQSTASLGAYAYISGSTEVDIIAYTPDAVFVVTPFVDNGACTINECHLQAEII